jgi:Cache 3/Cache 2 fusion domain
MQKVKTALALLKSKSEKLGPAKIEGTDTVEGESVPAVFFGTTKMNNNFTLVDEIVEEVGGTATIFVKSGADYIRRRDQRKEGRWLTGHGHHSRSQRQSNRVHQHE